MAIPMRYFGYEIIRQATAKNSFFDVSDYDFIGKTVDISYLAFSNTIDPKICFYEEVFFQFSGNFLFIVNVGGLRGESDKGDTPSRANRVQRHAFRAVYRTFSYPGLRWNIRSWFEIFR